VDCFVTGASGQLGTALLRGLTQAGHRITALVLPGDPWAAAAFAGLHVRRVTGDILDHESLPSERFDWVFHLVADQSFWRGHERRQRALNISGTANVIAWALQMRPGRVVHVSSLAAVGVAPGPDQPIDESFPFNGDRLGLMYFHTKWVGEQSVLAAAQRGLPAVVVNPGTLLGPWDRSGHALRMLRPFVRGLVRGYPAGGNNVLDVRDAAQGLLAAAERGRVGERYLLVGHNLCYRDLSRAVSRACGVGPPRIAYPRRLLALAAAILDPVGRALRWMPPITPDDAVVGTQYLYYDGRKARLELGFSVRPLDLTIGDALAWYRAAGMW